METEDRRSGACGLPVYKNTLSLRGRAEENLVQFFPQRIYLSKIIYHLHVVHYSNTIYFVGSVLSLDLKDGHVETDAHRPTFLGQWMVCVWLSPLWPSHVHLAHFY